MARDGWRAVCFWVREGLIVVTPEKDLIARFEVFSDTRMLAQHIYDLAHDEDVADLLGGELEGSEREVRNEVQNETRRTLHSQ